MPTLITINDSHRPRALGGGSVAKTSLHLVDSLSVKRSTRNVELFRSGIYTEGDVVHKSQTNIPSTVSVASTEVTSGHLKSTKVSHETAPVAQSIRRPLEFKHKDVSIYDRYPMYTGLRSGGGGEKETSQTGNPKAEEQDTVKSTIPIHFPSTKAKAQSQKVAAPLPSTHRTLCTEKTMLALRPHLAAKKKVKESGSEKVAVQDPNPKNGVVRLALKPQPRHDGSFDDNDSGCHSSHTESRPPSESGSEHALSTASSTVSKTMLQLRPRVMKVLEEIVKENEQNNKDNHHNNNEMDARATALMQQMESEKCGNAPKILLKLAKPAHFMSNDNKENLPPRVIIESTVCQPIDYYRPPDEDNNQNKMNNEDKEKKMELKVEVLEDTQTKSSPSIMSRRLGLHKLQISSPADPRFRGRESPCLSPRSPGPRSPRYPAVTPSPLRVQRSRNIPRNSMSRFEADESHLDTFANGIVEFALTDSPRCWERSFFR